MLFVPDPTVGTKGNIQALLKLCSPRDIPSVGYDPWFPDQGAVLTITPEYRRLGADAAREAQRESGEPVRIVPPRAILSVYNKRVATKMKVRLDFEFDDPLVRVIE